MHNVATIEQRIAKSEALWRDGALAEARGDYKAAYLLYTEAHDGIMDCPRWHQHAHVQLRRVNLKLGHYTELLGDWFLHLFAPLGIFELVAYFAKADGTGSPLCRRHA
jgi:hypothetical protein